MAKLRDARLLVVRNGIGKGSVIRHHTSARRSSGSSRPVQLSLRMIARAELPQSTSTRRPGTHPG